MKIIEMILDEDPILTHFYYLIYIKAPKLFL